jgi:uncharacterized protein YqgV (UPF0045/DUF77 family)
MELRVEFTTEPFIVGEVPDHASAPHTAAVAAGLDTDFGPFGTTVVGESDQLLNALPELIRAALGGGAHRISLQVTTPSSVPRPPGLHDALERLLLQIEVEFGSALEDLDRLGKQRAVRVLEERGAFALRGSVEDVADRLGVSRFTVYNYLNSQS